MSLDAGKEMVRHITSTLLGIEVHVIEVREYGRMRLEVLVPEAMLGKAIGRGGETVRSIEHLFGQFMKSDRPPTIRMRALEQMRIPLDMPDEELPTDENCGEAPVATGGFQN